MTPTTGGRSRAFLTLLVLTALVATATTALAVDVRGSLRAPADYGQLPAEPEEEQRRNHYWEEWNGVVEPRPRRFDASRELAVVLTGAGEMLPDQPGFSFSQGALRPSTIVERVGATLRIQNTDPVRHQLFAEGVLNPTPTSPGGARTETLSAAGSWPLGDQLYAHVRGHLHVVPDLVARATVQPDGTFVFRAVPAGSYVLKVFHGERELHSAPITVPEERELVVDPIAIGAAPAQ